MTDSEPRRHASQVIRDIYSLLNDGHIRELIDLPIEKAVDEFECLMPAKVTAVQFHDAIAALVQAIYANGMRVPLQLERDRAFAEAMHLLDAGYSSNTGAGYCAARTDAVVGGRIAMTGILASIAETLKTRERQRHIRYVLISRLEAIDWRVLREVAGIVEQRIASLLWPGERHRFRVITPADIAGFILTDLATDSLCDGILRSGLDRMPR